MPVDLKALFREHGVQIEINGDRGTGLPLSAELLGQIDKADLEAMSRLRISPGDMLTAVVSHNEEGQPVRAGGYLKMGVQNNMAVLLPRNDAPGEHTRIDATDTRLAAARILRMRREAGHEVQANERAHEKAMDDFHAAQERGEQVEEPVMAQARHVPAQFDKLLGFVAAARSVIAQELQNGFASAYERQGELMKSLGIANESRRNLTDDQLGMIAEAQSLRESIARLAPEHEMARAAIVAPYTGNGDATREGVERIAENGVAHFQRGVPAMGPAATLIGPLLATFTRTPAEDVYRAHLDSNARRHFEQEMARHENDEIGEAVRPRIEAVLGERMPGYECAASFYTQRGVDYLLIRDVGGTFAYAADSAARTTDLDIEQLNRVPTEADVPSREQIEELRLVVAELTFDNGAAINFDFDDDEDEPALEM